MNKIVFEIKCYLRRNKLKRLMKKLHKSDKRLKRLKEERIWVEKNPKINAINYFFYKIKKMIK